MRRADLEPDVTAATPVATTKTANTATAPKRRATATKVTTGKIAVKGKVSADKVQKSARVKAGENAKGGNGASKVQINTATKRPSVQTVKPKAKGKKPAEEDEVKDEKLRPGQESGTEPKQTPATEGRRKGKPKKSSNKVQKSVGTRSQPARNVKQKAAGNETADENVVVDQEPDSEREQRNELAQIVNKWKTKPRVPKSTKPKKGGIQAMSKAKTEAKANGVINTSKPKKQSPVSERVRKGLDPDVPEADKANKDQPQTPGKEGGKEKASNPHKTKEGLGQRFTRTELQKANALEWEQVKEPDLTNDIHPVWAIEKFRFADATNTIDPDIAYSAIAPALRLASLWVDRPEYESFWYRLWYGKYDKRRVMMQIVHDEESYDNILPEPLVQDEEASSMSYKLVRNDVLDEFQCEWRFGPQASGSWWTTEGGIAGSSEYVTTLHDDFERLAHTFPPETTTSERLRFYFFFAVNLVRALVQQVCQFKRREKFGQDVEPIARGTVFLMNSWAQMLPLEEAWEDEAFRGPISQINAPKGPMAPDGLAAYVRIFGPGGVRPGRLYQSLRMDWISGQFKAEKWVDEDGEIELDSQPLWEFDGITCYAKELAID